MKKVEMFLAFSSITNKSVNVRYRNVFSFEKLNNQVNEKNSLAKWSAPHLVDTIKKHIVLQY